MAMLFIQANFSPRKADLPMKISCKFGEASLCSFPLTAFTLKIAMHGRSSRIANTKPKYPPDASGGYNYSGY